MIITHLSRKISTKTGHYNRDREIFDLVTHATPVLMCVCSAVEMALNFLCLILKSVQPPW